MRLINTSTLEQREFFDSRVPRYAILSHTWGDDEVSLQQYLQDLLPTSERRQAIWQYYDHRSANEGALMPDNPLTPGWKKIIDSCRIARSQGFQWSWCDMCCIDKSSSAELSEAINSMYRWYQKAEVCYAFISDYDRVHGIDKLVKCRWFTRGWTLQELLAPTRVEFYDRRPRYFGNRNDLSKNISQITGIPAEYLTGKTHVANACISQRMYWASKRETTRVEDVAYSLLGIFDINLPLLYGEGSKAFVRLQREILAQSRDETIFAWTTTSTTPCGLLAASPRDFAQSGDIVRASKQLLGRPPSLFTNRGMEFSVTIYASMRWKDWLCPCGPVQGLEIPIECRKAGESKPLVMHLHRLMDQPQVWLRMPSACHCTYRGFKLTHEAETMLYGYTKIIAVQRSSLEERTALLIDEEPSLLVLASVLRIWARVLIALFLFRIDFPWPRSWESNSRLTAKAQICLFYLPWLLSIYKQAIWSLALLFLVAAWDEAFVAYKGSQILIVMSLWRFLVESKTH